jgi:signal peptidase II
MKLKLSIGKQVLLLIFLVLLFDQWLKIWIKTNMSFSDDFNIFGNWFIIKFIENPGMAFGMDLPGEWGKLLLTLFRIVAVSGIGYYLFKLIKESAPNGLILCIASILAGALGNIIDSVFYGVIFTETTYTQVASMFSGEGYATLMHGKVVDMLYFPIIRGNYPSWLFGGREFEFFRPIFNIADTAISVGVISILIFQRKHLRNL